MSNLILQFYVPEQGLRGVRKGDDAGPHEGKRSGLPLSAYQHQPSKAFSNAPHLIGLIFTLLGCKTEMRTTKHQDTGPGGSSTPSPVLPDRP